MSPLALSVALLATGALGAVAGYAWARSEQLERNALAWRLAARTVTDDARTEYRLASCLALATDTDPPILEQLEAELEATDAP